MYARRSTTMPRTVQTMMEKDRYQRRKSEITGGTEGNICAHHDDVAVGKVQHLGDTVYHCVSQCDDRVYASKTDAVDQV